MTSNIRVCSAPDREYGWTSRRAVCVAIFKKYAPDLIGFQEMRREQFRDLKEELPQYDDFGALDEPDGHPMDQIFYRRDRFELVTGNSFWLSETPDLCGSKSWGSDCIRLANAVLLRDRQTDRLVRMINTHLDHISQPAREQQAAVINRDAAGYPDTLPQILTGDMNCDVANSAIQCYLQGGWRDSYRQATGVREPGFSYHNFVGPAFAQSVYGKMDFILLRGPLKTAKAMMVMDAVGGVFPSDHYFVVSDFEPVPQSASVGRQGEGECSRQRRTSEVVA